MSGGDGEGDAFQHCHVTVQLCHWEQATAVYENMGE